MAQRIVHRIEDDTDRSSVLCTTYQMRNFYRQLADGFFSPLDVMNYVQHHLVAAKFAKPGMQVLDVCCGRGLLLPLLRFYAKDIGGYTGVDIEPRNATWQQQRVTDGKAIDDVATYYPFPLRFVESNAAVMADHLEGCRFDLIIYTSSIEHMHPDAGRASLVQCHRLAAPEAVMFLTCPRTPEDQDGYDTQYRAHVYEWKVSELERVLDEVGWKVCDQWGLIANMTEIQRRADRLGFGELVQRLREFVPSPWLAPILAPAFPSAAKEIGMICRPKE